MNKTRRLCSPFPLTSHLLILPIFSRKAPPRAFIYTKSRLSLKTPYPITTQTMASNASKLIPSDPDKVMVIRKVTPDILTMSTPFLRFGRISIGGRATIVKLESGNLALFSPVALTDNLKSEVASMGNGQIKYIVALDQEHHIFLEPWHKAFLDARVIAPETLPAYRAKQGYFKIPEASWTLFRKADNPNLSVSEEFDREFDMEYVSAHANHEIVFNHKPTKTMIQADLIFNLPATEQMSKSGIPANKGFLTNFFASLQNTKGDATWQKRFIWYLASASDRKSFNQSAARMAKWDFQRMIPCHGDVIEGEGKHIYEKVMQWHLNAAKNGK
ncbi:Hypothetical protein R9X50_00531600 [Acrodontium crateriforme]|uniref:DUF4336 domain-containing protein n=1 Tax=Acrodontium crateriforme TaxID=150365 RepID=A0AAQ3M7L6_9PEZI|nr:Hypothetical protein R9X50_00531600 [Acrodontium crateriforme]